MRCAFHVNFFLLIFCCGLHANAEKIRCTQQFKQFSAISHGHHDAPAITIEIINNQTVVPSQTDAPNGNCYFKTYFFTPVVPVSNKILIRRLLPDVHAIVKLLIFPQHIFW
ncbi:hypothetical protein SAMN05518672_103503 [Chitinophaga sp. CF118]|uniref:hypothetical protein n=1 Tax=Chitinophaga sp. CF118 TaxID=1884367 RepID=UPI0008F1903C|nr:hypothetical protein [Chitinophaga sp. CF118]SFD84995.1 hypothetical protein SAMN05518672_103503 [Chitinophaga sp. CF118]